MAQPRSTEQVRVSGAAKGERGIGPGSGGSCCGRPVAHPISRSLGGGRPHGYQLSGVGGTRNEEGVCPTQASLFPQGFVDSGSGCHIPWGTAPEYLSEALLRSGQSYRA